MDQLKYKSCIDACHECAVECDHCTISCLQEKDVQNMIKCIELNIYCADMCRQVIRFLSLGDDHFADSICNLCAEICEACSVECSKYPHDHCQRCATVCMQCAEECRSMIAA